MRWRGMRMLVWLLSLAGLLASGHVRALELPAKPFAELSSEEFRIREQAQAEILAWARTRPEPAKAELFGRSKTASDPEVRERCLAILRELVIDEYLATGEGFIGIQMENNLRHVPGDPVVRGVIRITQVLPNSAAQHAGLQFNDLIVGLGSKIWRDQGAAEEFAEAIRGLKPGTKISLKVLRGDKVLDIAVKLGRRPLAAENRFFGGRQSDLEAAEQAAKEAYFRRWLERKRAGT